MTVRIEKPSLNLREELAKGTDNTLDKAVWGDLTVNGNISSTGIDDNATATAVTVDASGNVGIGTDSPTFVNGGGLHVHNSAAGRIHVTGGSSGTADTDGLSLTHIDSFSYLWNYENGSTVFGVNNAERMRLTPSGNLLVGKTTDDTSIAGVKLSTTGSTFVRSSNPVAYFNREDSDGSIIEFRKDNATVGSISVTASATAYNTSSDYRLKENVVPMTGSIERVKELKPSRFNFISDPDTTVDGFIAHEAQAVVPESVHGVKDEVDDENNPIYQGIDQAKLVPLLTSALQEALTKIEELEARLVSGGL